MCVCTHNTLTQRQTNRRDINAPTTTRGVCRNGLLLCLPTADGAFERSVGHTDLPPPLITCAPPYTPGRRRRCRRRRRLHHFTDDTVLPSRGTAGARARARHRPTPWSVATMTKAPARPSPDISVANSANRTMYVPYKLYHHRNNFFFSHTIGDDHGFPYVRPSRNLVFSPPVF